MLSATSEGTTINISELAEDGPIEKTITESGSYTLTGSNRIGDEYVDTTITVKRGAVVDLYLDGLEINNGYTTKPIMPGFDDVVSADVFRINGTANIHVKRNSTITAIQNIFNVEGVVNFVESVDSATLTLKRPEGSNGWTLNMVSGSGEVHYKGANVTLINGAGANDTEYCKGKTYLDGNVAPTIGGSGTIMFDDICMTAYQVPGAGSLPLINGKNLHDKYGDVIVCCYSYGELPSNGKIVQLVNLKKEEYEDERPTQYIPNIATRREVDLEVGSDGTLSDTYLPDYVDMYIESDDTVTCYTSISGTVEGTTTAYSVTFVDKANTSDMGSYWAKEGDKVTLLEENGNYTYAYSLGDETPVSGATTVTGNTIIYVTKTEKGKVRITVNDAEKFVDYGAKLSSVCPTTGLYVCEGIKRLITPDEIITESLALSEVTLESETKNNKLWFEISTYDDLKQFAELVTKYGITDVNGYLAEDIQDYAGTMIGDFKTGSDGAIDFENSNFFRGSFDGRNHTVTLRYTIAGKLAGLFGSVSAGAEIKNVRVSGEVHTTVDMPESFTGALVASVICQNGDDVLIDNCINDAEVDSSSSQSNSSFVGGLVGGKYVQLGTGSGNAQMRLFIANCINKRNVKSSTTSGACIPSGIIGCCNDNAETLISECINYDNTAITPGEANYDSVKVKNSYSLKVVDYELNGKKLERGTEVTKEQFASGEVTYLLKANGSSRTWYQTCGVGLPSLVGDAATQTVYRGYENCTATTPIYSNTVIAHTEPGHKLGEAYRYADGKIYAGCIYCSDDDIYASVSLPTEYLGRVNGASAVYSTNWTLLNGPEITFKYAAEKEGEYSSELPSTAGKWYVRAYVGDSEAGFDIDGEYTTKAQITPSYDPIYESGSSDESGAGQNTERTGEDTKETVVEQNVQKLLEQFGEEVKAVGTESEIENAVAASKKDGVFVTSTGTVITNSFVVSKKGKLYFTNDDGEAVKSALVTDGKNTYYCSKSGAIICNKPVTLADGTRVLASETGVIITKENAKVTVNGKTYLTTKGGILASKEIVKAKNGKRYYANKKGEVVTNTFITIDGVEYKAKKNGSLKKVK